MRFLSELSSRQSRTGAVRFFAFFFISWLVITLVAAFNAAEFDFPRIIYVVLFLNAAALPYFFIDKTRGRYLLLAVFLPIYSILYCLGDLISVLGIEKKAFRETEYIQGQVDQIIIFGAIAYAFGYLLIGNIGKKRWHGWLRDEWDLKKVKIAGIFCWMTGTAAFITMYFFNTPDNPLPLSIISNLKYFAPMGSLMLVYHYLSHKQKSTLIILAGICIFELFLGFVANTKEASFTTIVLYALLSFISRGKINKTLLAGLIAVIVTYIFFFNAYRLWVIQIKNQTPLEAIENLVESVEIVIKNAGKKDIDNPEAASFLKERLETRKYIVILVDGIDIRGIRTMNGYTLELFFTSFVPRAIWPEKPMTEIGQLFNSEFKITGIKQVFIPASHLGEFYWNFKMPGVLIGMTLIGALMAFVSKMSDLSVVVTLPRVIVVLMTTYLIVVRFEVDMAAQYSIWVRVLFFIWILDKFLRRRTRKRIIKPATVTLPAAAK